MVKGTNRRVVVVKSPDPSIFEEAIFVVREDLFHRGNSAEKVMNEARRAAGAYLRGATGLKKPPVWRRPQASCGWLSAWWACDSRIINNRALGRGMRFRAFLMLLLAAAGVNICLWILFRYLM